MPRSSKEDPTVANPSLNLKHGLLGCILLLVAGLVAYHGSFKGPFIFDDIDSIVDNPTIRHLWPLNSVLMPPSGGLTVEGRPLLNFTLAINYALGGVNVKGYHSLNLGIHLLAGILLFGVFYKLFNLSNLKVSGLLAFCVALLWTVHPLQTESVTYVIQRAESLMGLFYVLSLFAFLKFQDGKASWGVISIVACYLGMATKEDMVSVPVIILLIDRTLILNSFKQSLKQRSTYYLWLFSSWIILGFLINSTHGRGGTVGFDSGLPAWLYWVTQFPAIIHYLQLVVWPNPLVFDYAFDRFWIWHPWATLPYAICVFGLLGISIWFVIKRNATGILGLFIFILLAPTSIIPGNRQAMAEHRMYLPIAAVIALLSLGLLKCCELLFHKSKEDSSYNKIKCLLIIFTALAASGFIYRTIQRNKDYQSNVVLWTKTVEAVPDNPFAHNSLGSVLFESHNLVDAEKEFRQAIALNSNYAQAHSNLAVLYSSEGRQDAFVHEISVALRLNPTEYKPLYYLALGLAQLGDQEGACEQFKKTIELKPFFADAHYGLGTALMALGKYREAKEEFLVALSQRPLFAEAENNLGNVYADLNQLSDALAAYQRADGLKLNYVDAINNIGITYAQMHDYDKSAAAFSKAIQADPTSPFVHNNYANVLKKLGRIAEARAEYQEALRIEPTYKDARANLDALNQEASK